MRDMSKNLLRGLAIVSAFIFSLPPVFANLIDDVLGPFQGINFGITYASYAPFIDGILFFMIFFGLTKFVFAKKFGNEGKMLVLGLALALSFSAAFAMSKYGMNLGMLGEYAIIVLFIVLFYFLYKMVSSFGSGKWLAFSIAFLVMQYMINIILSDFIAGNSVIASVFSLAYIASIIGVIYGLFQLFKGFSSGKSVFSNPNSDQKSMTQQEKASVKERKKEEQDIRKENAKVLNDVSALQADEKALQEAVNSMTARGNDPKQMELQDTNAIKALTEQLIREVNTIIPVAERMEQAQNDLAKGKVPVQNQQSYQEYINRNRQWLAHAFGILPSQISHVAQRLHHLQEELLSEDMKIKKSRQILTKEKSDLDIMITEMTKLSQKQSLLGKYMEKKQDFNRKVKKRVKQLITAGQGAVYTDLLNGLMAGKDWEQRMAAYLNSFSTSRDELRKHYIALGQEADQVLKIADIDAKNIEAQTKLVDDTKKLIGQITDALNKANSDPKKANINNLKTKLEALRTNADFEVHKLEDTGDHNKRIKGLLAMAAEGEKWNTRLIDEEQKLEKLLKQEEDFSEHSDKLIKEFLKNYEARNKDLDKGNPVLQDIVKGKFEAPLKT